MIIGSRWRYVGPWHAWLFGRVVVIRAVHRGPDCDHLEILERDRDIKELLPTDTIEIAPLIEDAQGQRISFVTSDALLAHLEPLTKEGERP